MKLSIITSYYNSLEYTKSLADILVPQLRDGVEWIVVDDGTGDDLSFLSSEYVKILYLPVNSGCAGVPRNKGLDIAQGEYITFVDSDDLVSVDFVDKILEKIESGFDYCLMSWKSDKFSVDVTQGRPEWNCSVWGIVYNCELIGGTRFSDLRIGEDYGFNRDVLNDNAYCEIIPEFLYYYRSNEKGIMANAK